MMNDIKFYIYGVPNGFNLYQGNAEDDKYFQLFYDGSKEESKLTINRKEDGDVTYNYLRYNMVSGGNRPGAFLGISAVFRGKYCADVTKLYNLFDFIYKDIIVKDGVLVEKSNNSYKFKITKFDEDCSEEIEKIFESMRINIEDPSSGFDIRPVDDSFTQSKRGLICKLAFDAGNSSILAALKSYSWLTVSKSYKLAASTTIDVELSPEQIKLYDDAVKPMKDSIIQCYKDLHSDPKGTRKKVVTMNKNVSNALKAINGYLKKQPQLKSLQEDYRTLSTQLAELNVTLDSVPITAGPSKPAQQGRQKVKVIKRKKSSWLRVGIAAAVICFVAGFLFFRGSSDKSSQKPNNDTVAVKVKATGADETISKPGVGAKNQTQRGDDFYGDEVIEDSSNPYPEGDEFSEGTTLSDMLGRSRRDDVHNNNPNSEKRGSGRGTIQVSSKIVSVGGGVTVTWTGDPIGEWRCSGGIINNRLDSKTTIKFSKPGSYDLYYVIDDQPVGSVKISVGGQSHGSTNKSQTKAQTKTGTQKPPVTSKTNQQGTQQQGGKTNSSGSGSNTSDKKGGGGSSSPPPTSKQQTQI